MSAGLKYNTPTTFLFLDHSLWNLFLELRDLCNSSLHGKGIVGINAENTFIY